MNLPPEFWTYLKVVLLVATVPAIVGFVIVLAENFARCRIDEMEGWRARQMKSGQKERGRQLRRPLRSEP